MLWRDPNPASTPFSILISRASAPERAGGSESVLAQWIGELGDDLMWIGMFDDLREPRCLPNHDRPDAEIRGWSEAPELMELVPDILDAACPATAGNVILRTTEALYIALCPGGRLRLVLGIEPGVPLARLGFA